MISLKKKALFVLTVIYTLFSSHKGCAISLVTHESNASVYASVSQAYSIKEDGETSGAREIKISSRIYELLFGNESKKKNELMLVPCGDVFGIRMDEEYVSVSEAESGSSFSKGDKILKINDSEITSASDITKILDVEKSRRVKVEILRAGERLTLTVTPKEKDGHYVLGITVKRPSTGIGTITFIDKNTGFFGGLGHGVCDSDSGNPIEIRSGIATRVILGTAKRGESGAPGELSGVLAREEIGCIYKNNECGVFGVLENYDTSAYTPLPVAKKCEIKPGEAEIISTVKNGKRANYKIEITEIDYNSNGSKSFKIKVTDPVLITLTGGIVRGMSGSPIIQNGKLVGAVTHVMVADPTEGYGIFIENMLSAAQNQVQPKAA